MQSFILPILSADHTATDQQTRYQVTSMLNFVCAPTPDADGLIRIDTPYPPFRNVDNVLNFCEWIGVECTDGFIESIRWCPSNEHRVEMRHLNTQWFPSTVTLVQVNGMVLRHVTSFSTRFLPKSAKLFSMCSNRLIGELDLPQLPQDLSHLYLATNWLKGTVDIRYLPCRLVHVDARENLFTMVLADNHGIHETLEMVYVGTSVGAIHPIKVVEVSGKRLDDRLYVTDIRKHKMKRIR